jgi:hypothetical protein
MHGVYERARPIADKIGSLIRDGWMWRLAEADAKLFERLREQLDLLDRALVKGAEEAITAQMQAMERGLDVAAKRIAELEEAGALRLVVCGACKSWHPPPDREVLASLLWETKGHCRRRPPTYQGWPSTNAYSWCDEGKAK